MTDIANKETFGTTFKPPQGFPVHDAGSVGFSRRGAVVSIGAVTFDGPYTHSVLIHGSMKCTSRARAAALSLTLRPGDGE